MNELNNLLDDCYLLEFRKAFQEEFGPLPSREVWGTRRTPISGTLEPGPDALEVRHVAWQKQNRLEEETLARGEGCVEEHERALR